MTMMRGPALRGLPLFVERYDPAAYSHFDAALDQAVTASALAGGHLRGVCNLVGAVTDFAVTHANVRESVSAQVSGSINRQRQLVCALGLAICGSAHASLPEITALLTAAGKRLYTAEANSALFSALRQLMGDGQCVGSEWFGPEYRSGEAVNGVMHQDLQAPSFAPGSFDVILTSEVLEHVADAPRAERAIVELLRPGGVYCFTVPFLPTAAEDIVLAEHNAAGELVLHGPAQYHGDPLRPEQGALVYRLFAHAALERRFRAAGCSFATYRFWSKTFGIIGDNAFVCVVRKPEHRHD